MDGKRLTTVAIGIALLGLPASVYATERGVEATSGTVQCLSVTETKVDEVACNYVPSRGDYLLCSIKYEGLSGPSAHTFEIPEGYPYNTVTFYIEHSSGDVEKLKRVVPDGDNPSIDVDVSVNGWTLVTAVLDLWDKTLNSDYAGIEAYYDPELVQQKYQEFAELGYQPVVEVDSGNAQITLVAKDSNCVDSPSIEKVASLEGTENPAFYSENYRPPANDGVCLGSYQYAFSQTYDQGSSTAADDEITDVGFKFTVDQQYAGQIAKVYIDSGPGKSPSFWGADGVAVHEIRISTDGSFTVPYGIFGPMWDQDETGNVILHCFYPFHKEDASEECSGTISVNIEPLATTAGGAEVNYRDSPDMLIINDATKVSIADSTASLSVGEFSGQASSSATGYEQPKPGGLCAGYFCLSATPYGEEGSTGYATIRIDLGKEYAGRKVTLYSGSEIAPTIVTDTGTYRVDDEGTLYLTKRYSVARREGPEGEFSLRTDDFFALINVEPIEVPALTDLAEVASIEGLQNQTWTGSPVTPRPKVVVGEETLDEGVDYELDYENNVDAGTATLIIVGKGSYCGELRVSFEIIKSAGSSGSGSTTTPEAPDDSESEDKPDYPVFDSPFSDVAGGSWYYDAVCRAHELGVMNGYGDTGLFGPDDLLVREQAAVVLHNIMGEADAYYSPAPLLDVQQGEWYSEAVNWAVASGVMKGYEGTGRFGVGDALTREQFAVIIANACGADVGHAGRGALDDYPDKDDISEWAVDAMAWAVENDVINGVELRDGTRELRATETLNRAQMCTMIVNAIDVGML